MRNFVLIKNPIFQQDGQMKGEWLPSNGLRDGPSFEFLQYSRNCLSHVDNVRDDIAALLNESEQPIIFNIYKDKTRYVPMNEMKFL